MASYWPVMVRLARNSSSRARVTLRENSAEMSVRAQAPHRRASNFTRAMDRVAPSSRAGGHGQTA
jgi:hypothetical protein